MQPNPLLEELWQVKDDLARDQPGCQQGGFCQSCSVSCGRGGEDAISQPFRLGRTGGDFGKFPVRGGGAGKG